MTVLLLSYDLNGHERPSAYEDVKDMIEANAISAIRPLFSQWLIETDDTLGTWHQRMKGVVDKGDNWLIVEVTRARQGWLQKAVWEWLDART
jgi:hypothetical protein